MNDGKICVSVCAEKSDGITAQIDTASAVADLVEIRFDCLSKSEFDCGDTRLMTATLDKIFSGRSTDRWIITFRPEQQGGQRVISEIERLNFWNSEFKTGFADLEEDILDSAIDPLYFDRICSYHDFSGQSTDVQDIYDRIASTQAEIVKIAISAKDAVDGISIWKLIESAKAKRTPIIPIAMGEAGKWTRILGLAHGAYLTYAALESGNETAPGQIAALDMIDVYRVKELDEHTDVYGIIAGNTTYTMSPYIHNAAFKATSSNAVFVPFQVTDLDAYITRMVRPETREVELNLRGFSVTNPHKQTIINYLDHIDGSARAIGAVNTIKIVDGRLHGYNTDAEGFLVPLRERISNIADLRVAIVGAGGASRACAYALKTARAEVTVFARDASKARSLADDLGLNVGQLENGNPETATIFSDFDMVVNTTPLGTRGKNINETAASHQQLDGVKLVYDLVYNPAETRLMREAKVAGAETLGGFDMLIAQAAQQFEIWTGLNAPIDKMSTAAKRRLYT